MKVSDILLHELKEEEDSTSLDIKFIINKYLRHWYFFLGGIVFFVGLGVLYLYIAAPNYSVVSTILIRDDDQGSDFSNNAVYRDIEGYHSISSVDNEIEILKSVRLMERVLTELSLFTTVYEDQVILKKRELYGRKLPVLLLITKFDSAAFDDKMEPLKLQLIDNIGFELQLDGSEAGYYTFGEKIEIPNITFSIIKNPKYTKSIDSLNHPILISFNHIGSLAKAYVEGLTIELVNKQASAVRIELVTPVPEKGKDIINKLVSLYNEEAIEDKNRAALNTIEFIDERLKYLTSELTNVEKSVEQYKGAHNITDVDSEAQIYLQSSSDYKRQLSEIEIQIAVVESMEGYLMSQKEKHETIPSSLSIENPTFATLIERYNDMQIERNRMLQSLKPNNPLVININAQLDNLRSDILQNLTSIKSNLEITRDNLQASSSQVSSRAQRVPRIERELLEISRQQGIKQEHYLYLLKKREESAIILSATAVSNSRVIDPAIASMTPVSPNKIFVLLASLILGVAAPVVLIFVLDLLNDKVLRKREIERITKVPILGQIDHNKKGQMLAITEKRKTPIAEQFRLVRSNIHFATSGKKNKNILVTSSMSGEGKTFFGVNLGMSLSMTGKKVVLVEFDLRKPALLKGLGLSSEIGLSNYLSSEQLSTNKIIRHLTDNLNVIGSGPIPADPAELMMSPRVDQLMKELNSYFDHVILDTAPIGQVADAYALANYTDVLIYVIRYNYTSKNQVEFINDIDRSKKFKNPMIVLNDAKNENSNGYAYGHGYSQ